MRKQYNIYDDTVLVPEILVDAPIFMTLPLEEHNNESLIQMMRDSLSAIIYLEYQSSEDFRKKLSACENETDATDAEAEAARNWLVREYIPSLIPDNIDERKMPFVVHRFDNAPDDLKEFCDLGGDEDWIVEIPPFSDFYVSWINRTDSMLEPKIMRHPTKKGWLVAVGSH